jgi:hypothetical protein
MSPIDKDRWQRTLTICGSIGIPLISVCVWLIVSGTHLVDTVNYISKDQTQTHARIDLMDNKIDRLIRRVDTLADKQSKEGLYEERIINGKRVFIPAK